MSSLPDSSDFTAAQPYSADPPQKIEDYAKPSRKNGWLVRNYAATVARGIPMPANQFSRPDFEIERVVRRSIVDPRFDVTLPVVKWMGKP